MSFYIFDRLLIKVPPVEQDLRFNRLLIAFKNGWALSTFQEEQDSSWYEAGLWCGTGDDWLDYDWFPQASAAKQFLEEFQELCPTVGENPPAFSGLSSYTNVANFSERDLCEYSSFLSKLPPVNLFDGPDRFGYWRDGLCLWGPVGPQGLEIYKDYLKADTERESRELLGVYLDHCEDHYDVVVLPTKLRGGSA